jgi:transcription initiation factor TFIIH subunit 2
MLDEEPTVSGYVWEAEYKRSWDILQEDEEGSLETIVTSLQQQQRRKRFLILF